MSFSGMRKCQAHFKGKVFKTLVVCLRNMCKLPVIRYISSGDIMYSIVTIANNTILLT